MKLGIILGRLPRADPAKPLGNPGHDGRMQDELPPLPPTPTGRYRHYKGGEYEVLGVARHSETLEPLVVYRPLYNATGLWVRPHAMFFETIEHKGERRPRFLRV